jgi:ketosteroid isomerase-like protein
MSATTTPFDVEALEADPSISALAAVLADDVEWIEVDQRTQPRAPGVLRGRAAVVAMLEQGHMNGVVSSVIDGFSAGDRAALTIACRLPDGNRVLCNALLDLRDGKIVRFHGVQAWDE